MPDSPLASAASSGVSVTFVNGKPIALVSCSKLWEGVGQIWALVTNDVRKHGLLFTKACRELIEIGCYREGYRRCHCIVDAEQPENVKWVTLLGFEYEFTMKKASPVGNDLLGYVKWINGIGTYKPSPLRETINNLF